MPGYEVTRNSVENTSLFDKYQCPHCDRLLRSAVQPVCGHWLCESCAEDLLSSQTPKCPKPDCQEDLKSDDNEGPECFPDRFVRREIEGLTVSCLNRSKGCDWKDRLFKYEDHLSACRYGLKGLLRHVDPGYQSMTSSPQVTSYSRTHAQEVNTVSPDMSQILDKLKIEKLRSDVRKKDEEILTLRSTITKLEKSVKSNHAEFEDRDFRLSLIESSNHDGSMVWKIPQFSQRMSDAQTGKYMSIFSLPFYTGKCGYKMCLRLYILGDGIGKNTHMSLFFVIMRGEFDNILQWPFTHKVTFKLINQTGGKDISDTFLPDPMSSSFRKPKSDVNVASGCPRFISHSEMSSAGFIVDDTVFIKCSIDYSNLKNP